MNSVGFCVGGSGGFRFNGWTFCWLILIGVPAQFFLNAGEASLMVAAQKVTPSIGSGAKSVESLVSPLLYVKNLFFLFIFFLNLKYSKTQIPQTPAFSFE